MGSAVSVLKGYVVRGGDGDRTALFGYAWIIDGPPHLRLVRASTDGGGQLIVVRFPPTRDGRRRAWAMAAAVEGTVKRVVSRPPAASREDTRVTAPEERRPKGRAP